MCLVTSWCEKSGQMPLRLCVRKVRCESGQSGQSQDGGLDTLVCAMYCVPSCEVGTFMQKVGTFMQKSGRVMLTIKVMCIPPLVFFLDNKIIIKYNYLC